MLVLNVFNIVLSVRTVNRRTSFFFYATAVVVLLPPPVSPVSLPMVVLTDRSRQFFLPLIHSLCLSLSFSLSLFLLPPSSCFMGSESCALSPLSETVVTLSVVPWLCHHVQIKALCSSGIPAPPLCEVCPPTHSVLHSLPSSCTVHCTPCLSAHSVLTLPALFTCDVFCSFFFPLIGLVAHPVLAWAELLQVLQRSAGDFLSQGSFQGADCPPDRPMVNSCR